MQDDKGRFIDGLVPRNKGIPMSDELRCKVSESLIGRSAWNKGIPMSKEQKEHQSKIRKGKPNGCLGTKRNQESKDKMRAAKLGKTTWNKGIPMSAETKKKLSDPRKGIIPPYNLKPVSEQARINIGLSKKGQVAWNKGIGTKTPENKKIKGSIEYKSWREAVFARDNWTCQKHGTKGGEIHPHHILNFAQYPQLRFAVDNGITLSAKAHMEFHKRYGTKNNTREQLEEFLTIVLDFKLN